MNILFFFFFLLLSEIGFIHRLRIYHRLISVLFKLPSPKYRYRVHMNVVIEAKDGTKLVADHYEPVTQTKLPTILMRTPYDRRALFSPQLARFFAQVGYHVFVQDTRGRGESEGRFYPFIHEQTDGEDTQNWLTKQPWFNGQLIAWGQSYWGYTGWAIAGDNSFLKAIIPIMTSADLRSLIFMDGAVRLNDMLTWVYGVENNISLLGWVLKGSSFRKYIYRLCAELPLREIMIGQNNQPDYFSDWFKNISNETYWSSFNHRTTMHLTSARPLLIAGWYDVFLREQLEDYKILRSEGLDPFLTITPFTHTLLFSNASFVKDKDPLCLIRESVDWMDTCLKGKASFRDRPVRYYELISDRWVETESWPPPYVDREIYLHSDRILDSASPLADEKADTFVYDPGCPTPSLGGAVGNIKGGPTDNRPLMRRKDVLNYLTAPLKENIRIAGPVRLRLYVSSSLEYTDFYGRLCVVYPNGLSINLCDGLFRMTPDNVQKQPDDIRKIEIDMWSTAARFEKGQRIQILLASGAFPRWSRNLGYGASLGTDDKMQIAKQTIYHDYHHPSCLILPTLVSERVKGNDFT